jgi:UDP-N-acetylglucosamine acyltransferase
MTTVIHPTALISPDAQLGEGVQIGPFAILGEQCVVGDGCVLAPRSTLERNVTLGPSVRVGIGSVLGGDPQDLKFGGEETFVEIGEGTVIREYVTINRGTAQSLRTTVGRHCLIMSYSHLAHDCHLGDHVIVSNGAQFAGHVTIEDRVIVSGVVAVHQFTRIGRFAFIGGWTRVSRDIPPYVKAVGNPPKLYGINSVGLRRNGFSPETIRELKRVYRLVFCSELNLSQALERADAEASPIPEVRILLDFVRESERGVEI